VSFILVWLVGAVCGTTTSVFDGDSFFDFNTFLGSGSDGDFTADIVKIEHRDFNGLTDYRFKHVSDLDIQTFKEAIDKSGIRK